MTTAYKALFAAMLAALAAYMRALVGPLIVLFTVMVLDYISGISAAWINGQLDSGIGIRGIIKKICYLLIVAVGMALDYLIGVIGGTFGVQVDNIFFVGLLVIVWLIINECISILENADEMKLPVPAFIGKLLVRLRRHTEEISGDDKE